MSYLFSHRVYEFQAYEKYKRSIKNRIIKTMEANAFTCINNNSQSTEPHRLNFHQTHHKLIQLHQYPTCSFSVYAQLQIHKGYRTAALKFKIHSFKLNGNILVLKNYSLMITKFNTQFNRSLKEYKLKNQAENNTFIIQLAHVHLEDMVKQNFILHKWTQIKVGIIQKLILNIQFQDNLTKNNLLKLSILREVLQLTMSHRKVQKNINQTIHLNKNLQHKKLTGQIIKSLVLSNQNYQIPSSKQNFITKQRQRQQRFEKALKQIQQSTSFAKTQNFHSIYEMALNKFNQNLQLSTLQQINQTNYFKNMVCRGIDINLDSIKELTGQKQSNRTLISWVDFIFCYLKYVRTINSDDELNRTNNQHNYQTDGQQQKNQYDCFQYKILARKRCLKMNQTKMNQESRHKQQIMSHKSFTNEYKFITKIRNYIFPYFAQYFLSPNQQNQNITEKSIYIERYQYNFQQYMNQSTGLFKQLSSLKILQKLIQIASMLKYLARNSFLHRDFKPANIMIDKYDRVKFIDWGSSCDFYKDSNTPPSIPLYTTKQWSQSSQAFQIQNQKLFEEQFGGKIERFQRNQFFDIYSFGVLIRVICIHLHKKHEQTKRQQNWLFDELLYLEKKMTQTNPFDRPTPLQILFYLNQLNLIAQQKNNIILTIAPTQNSPIPFSSNPIT